MSRLLTAFLMAAFAAALSLMAITFAFAGGEATSQPQWRGTLQAGHDALKKGHYDQAGPLLKSAVDSAAPDSLDEAEALNELGKLDCLAGHYDQADDLDHKSLALRGKLLVENDPLIAVTLENLGELDLTRGNYKSAEQELRRALDIRTKRYGQENADRAETMSYLGCVCGILCRYDEAEKLCAGAVEIQDKVLKADDTARAAGWDNLAGIYFDLGRLVDTEALFKRSLDLRTRELGEDHPDVAGSYDNLGWLYLNWGDIPRARRYFKLAEFTRENALGADHPDTVESHAMWVSLCSENQMTRDQAVTLLEKDVAAESKALGNDHVATITLEMNLADAYSLAKRDEDEQRVLKSALTSSRAIFGEDHVCTANVESRLAMCYGDSARQALEAEKLFKQSIATQEKLLGKDHRDLFGTLETYSKWLASQNRAEDAAAMHERAAAIEEADQKRNPRDDLQGPRL